MMDITTPTPTPSADAPNAFLRSSLFSVGARGARRYIKGGGVAATSGIAIHYTGEQLDQADLDVWLSLVELGEEEDEGGSRITAYALLARLGRADTGETRATLDAQLTRLVACAVRVQVAQQGGVPGYSYEGSLVVSIRRTDELDRRGTREYIIRLDGALAVFFAGAHFTRLDKSTRRALSGKPLAQWLHAYYSTHARPMPIKASTLLALAGCASTNHSSGRQTLRRALEAVSEASPGFGWRMEEGTIYVIHTPSVSQARHLEKRGSAKG